MSLLENVPIARRTMVLFFVTDTSDSMSGVKIGALNDAVRETVPDLRDLSSNNPDALIKIAVLKFDSNVQWLYPEPLDSEHFHWNDLQVSGITQLGSALRELNKKLSKTEFLKEAAGSFAPVIILLSDGEPTDDYKSELAEIKKNNWFKHAIKIAIAIGDDANHNTLIEFTGHSETVLQANNRQQLRDIIKFVSVTASQINSQSSGVDDTSKQQVVIDQIKEYVDTHQIDDVNEDEFN